MLPVSSTLLWLPALQPFRCNPQQHHTITFFPIPKKPGATLIPDYRPIACCNTIYKLISKLLVKRLKPLLPLVILPNQMAFVQGKLLLENTLLASEIVQGYHKNGGAKKDYHQGGHIKIFDTIRWEFLFKGLRGFLVLELYLRWLETYVCTLTFSMGFNGNIHGVLTKLQWKERWVTINQD